MYMLIEDCFRGDFDRIKFDNIPLIILSLELIVFYIFCYVILVMIQKICGLKND